MTDFKNYFFPSVCGEWGKSIIFYFFTNQPLQLYEKSIIIDIKKAEGTGISWLDDSFLLHFIFLLLL